MKTIHLISVNLFLLIYLVKTLLLLFNKNNLLASFKKYTKVLEMIVSVTFLGTGLYMFLQIGAIKNMQIIKLLLIFAAIPLAVIGFKKSNKILASIAFLMIVMAYGVSEMSRKKPYPAKEIKITTDESSAGVLGPNIYAANCVMCHGEDGAKGLNGSKDLRVSTMDKSLMIDIITNGKGNMPAYKKVLSPQEIEAVAEYVKTLGAD